MPIRTAKPTDSDAIAEIYDREVRSSLATFDTEPRSPEKHALWLADRDGRHPVTVLEEAGVVLGWAALNPWSPRGGYARTAEVSVYVREDARRGGVGRALLTDLIDRAGALDYRTLLARIEASGAGSLRLHGALGFQRIGTMHAVGEKFGEVRDVVLLEHPIRASEPHTMRFSVPFEYPVVFTRGVLDPDNPTLADAIRRSEPDKRHRATVFVDSGAAAAWPGLAADVRSYCERHHAQLELAGDVLIVPGGEAAKADPSAPTRIHEVLFDQHIDRHSVVLIVGGGAVLDMVGYAAATAHRGLRVVRLPTTVLSQNDGGVGVKNGVNAFGVKNFLGTFSPPFAVVNDLDFLQTLEPRDRAAGMAEAVKVALIRDAAFFRRIVELAPQLAAFERDAVEFAIRRCAELHLQHIATSGDPFEFGTARPLDYGHWAAHRLEAASGHTLKHGEAVAIGMLIDACYAVEIGMLAPSARDAIRDVLQRLCLPLTHESLDDSVLSGLDEFREHLGGELTITLLA